MEVEYDSLATFEHPGKKFLASFPPPPSDKQLEKYFVNYAAFLREESQIPQTGPCNTQSIFDRFCLQYHRSPLPQGQDAFIIPEVGRIFTNADQLDTRQRFSGAHELMEFLVDALRECDDAKTYTHVLSEPQGKENKRKEKLCDFGASELLMPEKDFRNLIVDSDDLCIDLAGQIAAQYGTSLIATICRCIKFASYEVCIVLWGMSHKPAERPLIETNQLALGADFDNRPIQKLRVQMSFSNKKTLYSIFPRWKSIDENSIVANSYSEGLSVSGIDRIYLKNKLVNIHVEGRPIRVGDKQHYLALYQSQI